MRDSKLMLVVALLVFPGPSCTNSDNLALLLDTLKTVQRAVCDDEMVSLACPRGTSISIQVAQYGKAAPEDQGCVAETSLQTEVDTEKKCKRPNAMQYSLLQTVVEACQKKPQCKFSTKPKPGLIDPCPYERKYVEVAYKCRPSVFRSRTGCQNDIITLGCNPRSRITIFDVQYGRTAYDSMITCPQPQGIPEETCMAPYASEKVMQLCLGKRRCQIAANSKTFDSSCKPHSRPYLKVIYACVPLGVLTERYESAAEKDELNDDKSNIDQENGELFDESDGAGERWGETNAVSPIADPALEPPSKNRNMLQSTEKYEPSTILTPKQNIERKAGTQQFNNKMILYIGIGILIIIIIITIVFGIHCYTTRKAEDRSKNGDMFTTEAPNVFNDGASDLDNDIDVSHISGTFYDPVHPDMIIYRDGPSSKGTLRAMKPLSTVYPCAGASMYGNVDYVPSQSREIRTAFTRSRSKEEESHPDAMTSPKSLGTYSNSQYYYG